MRALLMQLPARARVTLVRNKIDRSGRAPGAVASATDMPEFAISAQNGDGLDALRKHLKECMGYQAAGEGTFSARRRHLDAIERARAPRGGALVPAGSAARRAGCGGTAPGAAGARRNHRRIHQRRPARPDFFILLYRKVVSRAAAERRQHGAQIPAATRRWLVAAITQVQIEVGDGVDGIGKLRMQVRRTRSAKRSAPSCGARTNPRLCELAAEIEIGALHRIGTRRPPPGRDDIGAHDQGDEQGEQTKEAQRVDVLEAELCQQFALARPIVAQHPALPGGVGRVPRQT